jgi:hypothetical protein
MAAVLVADMASTGPAPSCSIGIHHPSAMEGPVSLARPLQPSAAPGGASQEDGSSAWNGGTVRSLDAVPATSDQAGDWGSLTAAALWAPGAGETAPPGSTAPPSVPPEAWLPLTMLAGLPHVVAEYHTGDAASPPRTALLMLDSGTLPLVVLEFAPIGTATNLCCECCGPHTACDWLPLCRCRRRWRHVWAPCSGRAWTAGNHRCQGQCLQHPTSEQGMLRSAPCCEHE